MQNSTTVLITGIGGPTPRSIARSLKLFASYGPYRIIGTDCNPLAVGLYQKEYVDKTYVVPRMDSDRYWSVIRDIIESETVDAAIVQPEVEVEGWGLYAEKKVLPCPVMLPPVGLTRFLVDKSLMASKLVGTRFIPDSIPVTHDTNMYDIGSRLGYPYWIRGVKGSGGFGSLRIDDIGQAKAWLKINPSVKQFLASSFLPGRHLACKLLYNDGELISAAAVQCVNYVMATIAPSGITGNTSFGRLVNSPGTIDVSIDCIKYLCDKLQVVPNGVLSVDLKEDANGEPKITEVNVRHMAYTSSLAAVGINFAEDMLQLTLGNTHRVQRRGSYTFANDYVFLRDVDGEPIVMRESDLLK